jgi:deoxycytidine triphosphate deaminase
MILSDREIRAAIKQRHIVIDPQPVEEQYNTSPLDLMLGDELLELRSLKELQQAEPAGYRSVFLNRDCRVALRTESLQKSFAMRPRPSRFISPFAPRIPRDCHMPLLPYLGKARLLG